MKTAFRTGMPLLAVVAALLALPACVVDVHGEDPGKRVDIQSPIGDLSVRTDVNAADTGLPVYPGARPVRGHGDGSESADVSVGNSLFGVKVVAARFESPDAQDRVLEFYRNEMKAYGEVIMCRGDVDFRGRPGAERPVCKERRFSRDVQLVAGTEDRQRIVSVKPRDGGSEFAIVYVRTRGTS